MFNTLGAAAALPLMQNANRWFFWGLEVDSDRWDSDCPPPTSPPAPPVSVRSEAWQRCRCRPPDLLSADDELLKRSGGSGGLSTFLSAPFRSYKSSPLRSFMGPKSLTLIQGAMTVVLSKPGPGGEIRALAVLWRTGGKAIPGEVLENL